MSLSPSAIALRWLNVLLRGLHLAAVVLLGAALLGAPLPADRAAHGVALSGFAMLALDLWKKPGHLREVAGFAVVLKLLLVGWMAVDVAARLPLFWLVVAASAVFAHAPASFRHRVLWGEQ